MSNTSNDKQEVYRITETSDIIASPVFYAILILTFILGLSSLFGFFQNPAKLKVVVDVLSERVSSADDSAYGSYTFSNLNPRHSTKAVSYLGNDRYSIFSKELFLDRAKQPSTSVAQRVSFNYDITSKQFWGNLDNTRIESASEESRRESNDAIMVGSPLSPDYHSETGDDKYSMKAGLIHL